jgi:quercetin dioxygenase-like cupin family protein
MTRTRRSTIAIAVVAAAAGSLLTAALDRTALAQDTAQNGMKRTILKRITDPGNPKYEIVLGISELAPGAVSGKHRHPGVEVGYVIEGALTVDHDGGPTTTTKAGEALSNENNAVHNAHNLGKTPIKTVAVWVVEKDKPLAEQVK